MNYLKFITNVIFPFLILGMMIYVSSTTDNDVFCKKKKKMLAKEFCGSLLKKNINYEFSAARNFHIEHFGKLNFGIGYADDYLFNLIETSDTMCKKLNSMNMRISKKNGEVINFLIDYNCEE